jgi:alpha-mannosidase
MLNVHLICHTHDDVGWLKTVDQYYTLQNVSLAPGGVQYTLDTVTEELSLDPNRKFLYIEQAFFQRWWREQDDATRQLWQQFVQNGQVEFGNGGWSMHDEAAPHYAQMVDNTYLGHKFLLDEFGVTPTTGWQIDPFGHSSTQAWLLSAEAGFNSLYFGRIDFQDHDLRVNESRLQFVWRASPSRGAQSQVFTGAFHSGNYGPPPGLCFDMFCSDGQVQDDPRLTDYNVDYFVNLFVNAARSMYNTSAQTGHIMFKMGSDFQYRSAREWFKNLDKLVHYVNLQSGSTGIHVLYSNPAAYTAAVNAANLSWTVKTDDFFPYRDFPHAAWTGYFTSRPALKGYVRVGGNFLRAVSLADAVSGGDGSKLESLWEAVGVTEHHDAVSGTSKQHVAYDYAWRIARGVTDSEPVLANVIQGAGGPPGVVLCTRLNESVCDVAQLASESGFTVAAFNWLMRPRTESLRIPIPDSWASASVYSGNGSMVLSSVVSNMAVPFITDGAKSSVVFSAAMPPAGFASFTIVPASSSDGTVADDAVPASISNGLIQLQFDTSTGALVGMSNLQSGINMALKQEWLWYNSSAGGPGWGNTGSGPNSYGQNSGAYIFRPNSSVAFPVSQAHSPEFDPDARMSAHQARNSLDSRGEMDGSVPRSTRVIRGAAVTEVQQVFADWLSQTIRLFDGQPYAEVEATIGPIPISDNLGKEVITRFTTDVNSGSSFYTDSNAREFLERVRNYRETYTLNLYGENVTNNYYPVDAAIRLEDSTRAFSVLPDRAQAGGSLESGQVELMAHRRLLFDDSRGVGEALNETVSAQYHPVFRRIGHGLVVRVVYRLLLDTPANAPTVYRPMMDRVFAAPIVMFNKGVAGKVPTASLIDNSLNWPINAHLTNLDARGNGSLVVRVTNPFQIGEGSFAAPSVVDLAGLFPNKKMTKVVETTLTANQPLASLKRLVWRTIDGVEMPSGPTHQPIYQESAAGLGSLPVQLTPQQFRTFMIDLE